MSWYRHLLMICAAIACVGSVGAQLRRPTVWMVASALDGEGPLSHILSAPAHDMRGTQQLDQQFAELWQSVGIAPAEPAELLQVARRLSLGLTGTVPSLQEIRTLESMMSTESETVLDQWLTRLFADRRYSDYLAERLARAFVGNENGPFIVFRRRRFVSWLSDCLHENRPYDQMVRAMICDEGFSTDSPAVNFVTVTNGTNEEGQPDPMRLAARTARAFLGVRLDCVQCHDDHLGGRWRQTDFHQLAAFYAGARSSGVGIRDTDHPYRTKYLGAAEAVDVTAEVPFGQAMFASAETPRTALANWVTHPENKAFARSAVNRCWAILFGRPLVQPIDDIDPDGPHPKALDVLADDFVHHQYDLQHLIRTIVHARVFQLDSRGELEVTDRHEANWAVFPVTRLRPEQVAGGVIQSSMLTTINADSHILVQLAKFGQTNDFVTRYGDPGEDEFAAHGGTIPQRLLMLNGELVTERTKDDLIGNAASRVAAQVTNDRDAIEAAYLVVLTRRPTTVETAHFLHLLANNDVPRAQHMEDLFWALLNSAEFSWSH